MKSSNAKLSLSTPLSYVGGIEVQLHSFLRSVIDGGESLAACVSKYFALPVNLEMSIETHILEGLM